MTAYLRCIPYILRLFFEVPPCRFFGLHGGNEPGHIESCVVLYQRACRAVRTLVTVLGGMNEVIVLDSWDLILRCRFR